MSSLTDLRSRITTLDTELLRLLDERMEIVTAIGRDKIARDIPIYDAVREGEIMSRIPERYHELWDAMMDTSKRAQYSLTPTQYPRVAIQGGKGSFNEIALHDYMERTGERMEIIYAYTTEAVLQMLARGEVAYGQFAIANSIGGLVQETLDALGSKRWNYKSHYAIPIRHCLMIHPSATREAITTIMGHEQAIRQCEQTLATRFPQIPTLGGTGPFTDNASVAAAVASGALPSTTASIGHESLAEIYGLTIIERDIQDRDDNQTTFVLIGREESFLAS